MTEARAAVLEQLAVAYEHWAEEEQHKVEAGSYVEAEGAHQYALLVLKAMDAEEYDRTPKPSCACVMCLVAQARRMA